MELNTPTTESEHGEIRSEEHDLSFLGGWLAKGKRVFALLDACDEPLIPPKVLSLGNHAVSLYRGSAEQDYSSIAPYVAAVDQELIDWIYENLDGTPWGYFTLTEESCSLHELRKHFRRFLTVLLPDRRAVLFRFYDPRVIKTFLETADQEELRAFFGPVNYFSLTTSDQKKMDLFQRLP